MDVRDPFPRRTATPDRLLPWLGEVLKTAPALGRSYLPGAPLDPRTREKVILAVTEVNGCRYCAWIHGEWQEFLGGVDAVAADEAVLAYAQACAEAGEPLDPEPLSAALPPEAVRAVRATVAQIEVANLVGNTVDGMFARLTRKRPLDPLAFLTEAATIAVAAPVAAPLLALAGAMRVVNRVAPPVPTVAMPPSGEANLLVHLLAQAAPSYLGNAIVRLGVLGLPLRLSLALKAGRTAATIRIGRGRMSVENGVAPDALLVVEGDVEPLLQLASGSIVRELSTIRIRPN